MLGVLVVLDLGRSLYARLGYARPTALWQPAPWVYADLAWPPGHDLPATAPPGQRLYAQRCAVCHGPDGRGNGPAAPSLIPRPRDLTLGQFKYTSTPPGQPPSDADLLGVLANGLQASAMPAFGDLLSPDDLHQLVSYIKGSPPSLPRVRQSPSRSHHAWRPMRPAWRMASTCIRRLAVVDVTAPMGARAPRSPMPRATPS